LKISEYKISKDSILVLIFSILSFFSIDFIGRLKFSELFALLVVSASFFLQRKEKSKGFYLIVLGYLVILLGLIITDIYNSTPIKDLLKGWAMVGIGLVTIIFLTTRFTENFGNVYLYLISLSVLMLFNIDDNIMKNSNYFKTAYAPALIPIFSIIANWLWSKKQYLSILFILACGILFILLDARAYGVIFVFASCIILFHLKSKNFEFKVKILYLVSISFLMYGLYAFYAYQVVNHDFGGTNTKQLTVLKNPYNPFELVLEGRKEILVSIQAIKDRPFLGFGSWARDKDKKYERKLNSLQKTTSYEIPLGVIPKHSVLLGAWIWGGIISLIGVIIVVFSMFAMFIARLHQNHEWLPIISIYYIFSLWSLFFSPVGHLRETYPFIISLLIVTALPYYQNKRFMIK